MNVLRATDRKHKKRLSRKVMRFQLFHVCLFNVIRTTREGERNSYRDQKVDNIERTSSLGHEFGCHFVRIGTEVVCFASDKITYSERMSLRDF